MKQFFKWFVPSLAVVFGLISLNANAKLQYDESIGLGYGMVEWYGNNCQPVHYKGKKLLRVTDKAYKITSNYLIDVNFGKEVSEALGCRGLYDAWSETQELRDWADTFFGKLEPQ